MSSQTLSLHRVAIGHRVRTCGRCVLKSIVIAILAVVVNAPSRLPADDWTNVEGTKTIDAAFMGMWGDMVVLRLPTGKRAVIPKRSLNAESRIKAEELALEKAEARARRMVELEGSDEAETPTIVVAETEAYAGPTDESVDLQTAMTRMAEQIEAGHLRVVWDDLPSSYQDDVRELVQMAAQNLNAQDVDIVLRLINQTGRTLAKQKNFVFNYHRLESVPPDAIGIAKLAYDPVTGVIQTLGDTELLTLSNLGSMPLDDIIAKKDEQLAPYIAALIKLLPPEQNPIAQLQAADIQMDGEDQGRLTINGPTGEPYTQTYVRLDGRWIEQSMVQQWDSMMQMARQSLSGMSGSDSQLQLPALAVGGMLTQIENAQTQQEFDEIIDTLFGQIMAAMPANLGSPPGMGGGGPGLGLPPGIGGGQGSGSPPGGAGGGSRGPIEASGGAG